MLLALPLLPLAVALWLVLSSCARLLAGGWIIAVVATVPVAVALLAGPERVELPDLLLQDTSAMVLDEISRAALFLFGGLWLTAGLLRARSHGTDPSTIAMLVALSGATALALAEGGPMIYAGMLVTGYGLYTVMACEPTDEWRRAGRVLIVLLVVSDLLVFEILLASTAYAAPGLPPGLVLLGIAALVLRGGIPPAHAWLPPALAVVSVPTAMLLVSVPTAAALFGALKVLPGGAPQFGLTCLVLGLAGAAWATIAGLGQGQARPTLGYALAATAALLLMALPAGTGEGGQLAWLVLALLASCATLPLVAVQAAGWMRDSTIVTVLLVHGFAGGHTAVHASQALPAWGEVTAPLAALAATLLLTVACRRSVARAVEHVSMAISRLAFLPVLLACAGLGIAWAARTPEFASTWIAPVGVTLGLVVFRFTPRQRAHIPPGDLLVPAERAIVFVLRWLRLLFVRYLPRLRDATQASLWRLWDGQAWSQRMRRLDIKLRAWPATGVMMLAVALGAAVLLAR
jgi:hypothetical protein